MDLPETRYALSGDVSIAYQVHGEGPIDLVVVPVWITNVEHMWEESVFAAYYRRIGETARVIRFDKRGTGLSDRARGDRARTTRARRTSNARSASSSHRSYPAKAHLPSPRVCLRRFCSRTSSARPRRPRSSVTSVGASSSSGTTR